VQAAAAALPPRLQFVGGHPVAGAAVSGVGAARADLFERRPWILTPDSSGEPGIAKLTAWIEAMGATVHRLTPESHDRLVSMLSHLPQITASALMQVVGNCSGAEGLALAGPGLRDTTRLASSGASIWRDIAATNQDNIGSAIGALVSVLVDIKADLAGGNAALVRTFDAAAAWRATLEGHVGEQGPGIRVTRSYLEMRARSALQPGAPPGPEVRVEQVHDCPPAFWRFLYVEVGRRYQWIDRLPWTDDQIRAYLADPRTSLWLLSVSGAPAGYFELRRHDDDSVEIAYFGLLDRYHGRGLGGHLLTVAAERAWALGPARVWMHTNTLDHPAALPNYLKRGFVVFRTEEYIVGRADPAPDTSL
jgi:GNAT superfamily N-acetyltransferase